jgi:hypothetical protein
MNRGYLSEAIKGKYHEGEENRLTQVFAASFNQSAIFRKKVCELCDIAFENSLRMVTQSRGEEGQIDILLISGKRAILGIENKIDAPLDIKQLQQYERDHGFMPSEVLAIVKRLPSNLDDFGNYRIKKWSALYDALNRLLEGGGVDIDSRDGFVLGEFKKHLEDINMARVTQIKRGHLRKLADAVDAIANRKREAVSLKDVDFFAVASDFRFVLEDLVAEVNSPNHRDLVEAVGKGTRFNPFLSNCLEDELYAGTMISVDIYLKKEKPSSINSLEAGIYFPVQKEGEYQIFASCLDPQEYELEREELKGKRIYDQDNFDVDKFINETLRCWKKWLAKTELVNSIA